ncbi:O-antigen ligase family protein [Dechloromonas denitrificans]|uniref:O-antigen ligase family protein n=1 Tax=Dechloromonas denitrificans TaxID=281362 RepID=UPI001CF855EB|nr:O-antigen ligase family protein [Dechloromonas denitrificans]UCV03838.1 O-antigen ligase family protein [Dechloromonas denitrificans]UCV08101.1 O-antigen ligase family protein [Dechloromonas denitrificans]
MTIRAFEIAFGLFLFILPIPGTIALRNVLLLTLLLLMVLCRRELRQAYSLDVSRVPGLAGWLAALSAWIVLQAVWISDETAWALKESLSQWLPALLAAAVGVGAVLLGRFAGWSRSQMLGRLVLLLLAQTIFSLLVCIPDFLADGVFPQGKTILTAGKLEISYWNNLLLAFLAVDGLTRWLFRQRLCSLPTSVLVGGIVIAFFSNLAFGARNGVIGSLLLLSSLLLLVLWHERKRRSVGKVLGVVVLGVAVMSILGWANYQLDPRWARFEETAQVAWQAGPNQAWLHPDDTVLPRLKSGESVEPSAYFRIAWIRAGLNLVADYPWGVGYGRNAFGHALRKTMETRLGHAHSGLIDWTVGLGIPGLCLAVGFLSWAAWVGVRRYFAGADPAGLILTFVVGGFFGRMALDSINRDHMLMVFFLVLAILLAVREETVKQ